MGPTHAASGAAVGLAVAQLLPAEWGGVTTTSETFLYAGLAAGAALLPDLDSPQATVSRSFGAISQSFSRLVENVSQFLVNLTKSSREPRCGNGHRTFTHTLVFVFLSAALASWLISEFGKPATIAMLFLLLGLAIRGLLPEWSKRNDWLAISSMSALLTLGAWHYVPLSASGIVLGSAVGVGVLTHIAGDLLTKHGVPLFAPIIPVGGHRWGKIRLPKSLRITASGEADKMLLLIFIGLTIWQSVALLAQSPSLGNLML